jgi:MOSC domain-containing protein YiiM
LLGGIEFDWRKGVILKPSSETPLGQLLDGPMRKGQVVWIGLRPRRQQPLDEVKSATLVAEQGIAGDHYTTHGNGSRQVTLVAEEDIEAIASFLGRENVTPELLRRNIVARGINLVALKNRRFRVGPVLLEGTGECAPCSRMEANLGPGGFNAVRGHGGVTARIIAGGEVKVGDVIERDD